MQRILVALDGSDHSQKALELASDLAEKYGAELVLTHVLSDQPLSDTERHLAEVEFADDLELPRQEAPAGSGPLDNLRSRAIGVFERYGGLTRRFRELIGERILGTAETRARERGATSIRRLILEGDPAKALVQAATDENAGMLVMGSRGLGDAAGLLMGSVSHKVSHLADCTCVMVK